MEKLPLSPAILEEKIGYQYKNKQLLLETLRKQQEKGDKA